MPAVQIERLAKQVEELEESFEDPPLFMRRLHSVMNFYSDRTFRGGDTANIRPILSTYQIPQPILRHITQHLTKKAQKVGRPTLAICDSLWQEPIYEFRMIASHLLGQIPVAFSSIVLEKVSEWAPQTGDTDLLMNFFNISLAGVRKNDAASNMKFLAAWINSSDPEQQRLGCLALFPLIEDPQFENFPAVFNLLTPVARIMPTEITTEITDLVKILIRRSPAETIYFLRQVILTSTTRRSHILIRLVMPDLPPNQQAALRSIMRED